MLLTLQMEKTREHTLCHFRLTVANMAEQKKSDDAEAILDFTTWEWMNPKIPLNKANCYGMPEQTRMQYLVLCLRHEWIPKRWRGHYEGVKRSLEIANRPILARTFIEHSQVAGSWYFNGFSRVYWYFSGTDLRDQQLHVLSFHDFQKRFTNNKAVENMKHGLRKLFYPTVGKGPNKAMIWSLCHVRNLVVFGITWSESVLTPRWRMEYLCWVSDCIAEKRQELEAHPVEVEEGCADSCVYTRFPGVICQDMLKLADVDNVIYGFKCAMLYSEPVQQVLRSVKTKKKNYRILHFNVVRAEFEQQDEVSIEVLSDWVTPPCTSYISCSIYICP